jgi:hypothetical protein
MGNAWFPASRAAAIRPRITALGTPWRSRRSGPTTSTRVTFLRRGHLIGRLHGGPNALRLLRDVQGCRDLRRRSRLLRPGQRNDRRSIDCGGAGAYTSELAESESYIASNQNTAGMDPGQQHQRPARLSLVGHRRHGRPAKDDERLADRVPEIRRDRSRTTTPTRPSTAGNRRTARSPADTLGSPYMIDCSGYDSEKTWLTKFLGTLNAKNTGTLTGSLINFNQRRTAVVRTTRHQRLGLRPGELRCRPDPAAIVVALDGCEQYQAVIGTSSSPVGARPVGRHQQHHRALPLSNDRRLEPDGCWDWWGYTNSSYALKSRHSDDGHLQHGQASRGGTGAPTPTPAPDPDAHADANQWTATPTPTPKPSRTAKPTPKPTPTPTATPSPSPPPTATPTPAPTATPSPTAKPTATPTPSPSPTPSSLGCWTTNNYAQTVAGRAYFQLGTGDALAEGSNENMGLDNTYYVTSLNETSAGYYVIVSSCP